MHIYTHTYLYMCVYVSMSSTFLQTHQKYKDEMLQISCCFLPIDNHQRIIETYIKVICMETSGLKANCCNYYLGIILNQQNSSQQKGLCPGMVNINKHTTGFSYQLCRSHVTVRRGSNLSSMFKVFHYLERAWGLHALIQKNLHVKTKDPCTVKCEPSLVAFPCMLSCRWSSQENEYPTAGTSKTELKLGLQKDTQECQKSEADPETT